MTESGDWTLTATAPASVAAGALKTPVVRHPDGVAAAGDLDVPADLRDTVASVRGLDTRPILRHHAAPSGLFGSAELRTAYRAPAIGSGAGTTVATVQFSGWSPDQAVTYAKAYGLPDPTNRITTIPVRSSDRDPTRPDGSGGDFEVAMDVEMVFAAAPAAAQQVYVAENSASGMIAEYNAVADAAEAGRLTAVSTSWGVCERTAVQANLASANPTRPRGIHLALQRILAAGVTVFAASGDAGANDCGDGSASVDYPAASPYVVGVGGTALAPTGTGGYTETAWGPGPGNTGAGSGGGTSSIYPTPAWQAGLPAAGGRRMVPDIAATAYPRGASGPTSPRGAAVYASADGSVGWYGGGGTSAAAPLSAGLLAATLSTSPNPRPVGDIHPLLYAHPEAIRDVTSGGVGSLSAVPGYDRTTGLGSPMWEALAPHLTGGTDPTGTDPITAYWTSLGAGRSVVGNPVGARYPIGGGFGQDFQGGRIYWSAATGAHEVHGAILGKYLALGGPAGFPTSDETGAGPGRFNTFTGASILWTAQFGAYEVHGLIRDRYTAVGGPSCYLGYPRGDEYGVPGGRASDFTGGVVYWSPPTGAHVVIGLILDRYRGWAAQAPGSAGRVAVAA